MEGEEAEETERRCGDKATDLGCIDGVEVEIFDYGSNQGVLAQGLIEVGFDVAGVEPGKVDEVEVKTRLGSGSDDEEGNKSQGDRAIPKKATDHQHEKEVEAMEELLVIRVLHFAHSAELVHPDLDLRRGYLHPNEFAPSSGPVPVCFMSFSKPCEGGRGSR